MARPDNERERDVPAEQGNPSRDEEMIRGVGDEDDADDEFEDTEDLDDEQGEAEGRF